MTYIPSKEDYNALISTYTMDQFTQDKIVDVDGLEQNYNELFYDHLSRNTKFVIIRKLSTAKMLDISNFDIGQVYCVKRQNNFFNNESNWPYLGTAYEFNKIEPEPGEVIRPMKLFLGEEIYKRSLNYVNRIQTKQDILDLFSTAAQLNYRTFFVYYSRGPCSGTVA